MKLPPPQIKAFARSHGIRAKTDRIDAKLIASFIAFRPEAGRALPTEKLQIPRTLTTRRAQLVGMRKRLVLKISARTRQAIPAHVDSMDDELKALLDAQILELESRIEPGKNFRRQGSASTIHSRYRTRLCSYADRGNAGNGQNDIR